MNIDDKRGTGRTTTLLRAALQRATENRSASVVVVVSHYREIDHVMDLMRVICGLAGVVQWKYVCHLQTFIIDKKLSVRLLILGNDAIDVRELRVRGVDEKDTFFDHHAIETIIGRKALDLWIKYDHPSTKIRRNLNGQVV